MSNWQKVRLGDVCDTIIDYRGKTPLKLGADWSTSGYRALSARNIKTGEIVQEHTIRYVDEDLYKKWMKDEISRGDIIITSEAPFGEVFYWDSDEKIVLSQRLFGLKIKKSCCPKYLYYYMTSFSFQEELKGRATGTTVLGLRQPELLNCNISLPSLPEQERIAAILSSLDDKIELNNRINKNLEEQAQALFKRWFVDFEFPDADGKPYASNGGKFIDSELGKIPEGWKVGAFSNIVEVLGGGTPKTTNEDYWNGDIPFFTPKDVKENMFILSTEKKITNDGLKKCNSKLYPAETVFITARGTVGKVALSGCDMAMNQSCYALLGMNGVGQYFVYYITKETVSRLRNKAYGAVFDAITTRDFDSEYIKIPLTGIINKFDNVIKSLMRLILNNTEENRTLAVSRDLLLQKLMNNEIKIK